MPPEELWHTFFSPKEALMALGLRQDSADVVDFGCGYGTFTIPAARIVRGLVHAFDIETGMVDATQEKAEHFNLSNVRLYHRDFVAQGTGLEDESVEYAMLFNILHAENPETLLSESFRILRSGGILGIMHWNYDLDTPRGPPMTIRPKPEQCAMWGEAAGFQIEMRFVDLPPYHYGIVARKGQSGMKLCQP